LISGSEELGLNEEDLEEDFDPEKYDQRMSEIFKVKHFPLLFVILCCNCSVSKINCRTKNKIENIK
jgi:hypothetical protein